MNLRRPVLILLLAPLAAAAEPAPAIGLDQAIQAVLARYPTVEAAQSAIEAARGRVMQAGAGKLPQVSAGGAYAYTSLRPTINFALPGAPPSAFYTNVQDSYNAALEVRQLLTDFGRTDTLVELARTGAISARDALDQARSRLGYATIGAFYRAILLRASVAVADEEVGALEESLRIAERKFSGGTATKFDVLTTQVRLANARNRRTDTAAALEKQESLLRQLLGTAPGEPVGLAGGFDVATPAPDPASALADARRNRPELRLARDSERSAQLALEAAARESRPALAAQAAGGVRDGDLPALYASKAYVTAGLSVSVPLFTGRRITGERITARADLRGAEARASELDRTIATEVEDAFTDLRSAEARLASSAILVAQADEALSLAKSRYANGVITNFELLDAQSNARAAEQGRLQAQFDRILARQEIARASGRPPQATP